MQSKDAAYRSVNILLQDIWSICIGGQHSFTDSYSEQ